MNYYIQGFHSHSDLDDYNEGCIGEGGDAYDDTRLSADTQDGLIDAICKHFDVKRDAISLNTCEDIGRVDIQRMEDSDGYQPNKVALDKWKEGALKLWLVDYTGQLEVKTPGPAWETIEGCNHD